MDLRADSFWHMIGLCVTDCCINHLHFLWCYPRQVDNAFRDVELWCMKDSDYCMIAPNDVIKHLVGKTVQTVQLLCSFSGNPKFPALNRLERFTPKVVVPRQLDQPRNQKRSFIGV